MEQQQKHGTERLGLLLERQQNVMQLFAGNYTSTASLDVCSVTVNAAAVTFLTGHSLRVGEI